jgi:hypothetical protein
MLEEVLPLARGVGSPEYLGALLEVMARLELARGNSASGRQAIRESMELVSGAYAWELLLRVLPTFARLLPPDEVQPRLAGVPDLPPQSMIQARLAESDALLRGAAQLSRQAADLYREAELPYEEARCRVDAGELDRARELVEEYGFAPVAVGLT